MGIKLRQKQKFEKSVVTFWTPKIKERDLSTAQTALQPYSKDGDVTINGFIDVYTNHIVAVHLEKHRREKGFSLHPNTSWVRTLTYIPLEMLNSLPKGSTFKQHKNHWELIVAI